MCLHDISNLLFNKADVMDYDGDSHWVLVYYFTKWIELIYKKGIFVVHGVPLTVSPHNTHFGSYEITFSNQWQLQKITSPLSLIDWQREHCKQTLRKYNDVSSALLEYRNTPIAGLINLLLTYFFTEDPFTN